MQNMKKIVGLDLEKFDKVYFRDIQTDRELYRYIKRDERTDRAD